MRGASLGTARGTLDAGGKLFCKGRGACRSATAGSEGEGTVGMARGISVAGPSGGKLAGAVLGAAGRILGGSGRAAAEGFEEGAGGRRLGGVGRKLPGGVLSPVLGGLSRVGGAGGECDGFEAG